MCEGLDIRGSVAEDGRGAQARFAAMCPAIRQPMTLGMPVRGGVAGSVLWPAVGAAQNEVCMRVAFAEAILFAMAWGARMYIYI